MAVTFLVRARVQPEHLDAVLAAIRDALRPEARRTAGRQRERIFQSLAFPEELVSIGQWASPDAFEAAAMTLRSGTVVSATQGPPRVYRLERLLSFERPLQRSDVTACALIVPTRGDSPVVRERVVQDRRELREAPGLVSHEIYFAAGRPPTYVSVHSWRHLADLERFRSEIGALNERRLAEVGATLERFTGALVAEYPLATLSGRV